MGVPRFYCPGLRAGLVALPEAEVRHAVRSRRLRPGDSIQLFDGQGGLAHGTLISVRNRASRRRADASAVAADVRQVERFAPPRRSLTVVVAACKGRRLDFLVEKCTELGVACLVFAEFARSVVHLDASSASGLQRTAIEACKQAGRLWLPRIETGRRLKEVIPQAVSAAAVSAAVAPPALGELLVAHPAPDAVGVGQYLAGRALPEQLTAVVGPEGGLTEEELAHLEAAGATRVRLAAHILRVETAAAALAAAWAAWVEGD
jgi:16S rRNA (uracil1498-N3)-methyltransferase